MYNNRPLALYIWLTMACECVKAPLSIEVKGLLFTIYTKMVTSPFVVLSSLNISQLTYWPVYFFIYAKLKKFREKAALLCFDIYILQCIVVLVKQQMLNYLLTRNLFFLWPTTNLFTVDFRLTLWRDFPEYTGSTVQISAHTFEPFFCSCILNKLKFKKERKAYMSFSWHWSNLGFSSERKEDCHPMLYVKHHFFTRYLGWLS